MNNSTLAMPPEDPPVGQSPRRISIENALAPLKRFTQSSRHLTYREVGRFQVDHTPYEIPCWTFQGPKGGDDSIRVGLFSGIHGDEPPAVYALVRFLMMLSQYPELAQGYDIYAYPVCNPTGLEDGTRYSRRGRDLNREFWVNSREPEILLLEKEIREHRFQGLIALHTDDTSEGMYGFARGATLTRDLLKPALAAADKVLPRNEKEVIDGFEAESGMILKSYDGVLSAPPASRPRPFEIILESPQQAPHFLQEQALVVGLTTILTEYRKLIAYASNI